MVNKRLVRHKKRLFGKIVFFVPIIVWAVGMLFPVSWVECADKENPTQSPEIMTWVTLSGSGTWKAKLESTFGGAYCPRNTLTRIGVQFFNVCPDGSITEPKSDADLLWIQKYCRNNGIKFLLCFTNFSQKNFDWNLAVSAFAAHKDDLITNIMRLVETWSADGVDIDFEGTVKGNPSREEFAVFIKELSNKLHPLGKELTVDSFPYIWGQPNVNWWADWTGYVDCINSMGYENLCGGSPTAWRTYKWQQDQALNAGLKSHQLALGMAGHLSNYGEGGFGTGILDHIRENLSGQFNTEPSSVCIWSASFRGEAWQKPEVWEALNQLKNKSRPLDQPAADNSSKIRLPETPINLKCREKTSRSVTLVWTAPDSNRGVAYTIYIDSKMVGLTSFNDFTATGLSPDTKYTFTVKARNDLGEAEATVTVTTDSETSSQK